AESPRQLRPGLGRRTGRLRRKRLHGAGLRLESALDPGRRRRGVVAARAGRAAAGDDQQPDHDSRPHPAHTVAPYGNSARPAVLVAWMNGAASRPTAIVAAVAAQSASRSDPPARTGSSPAGSAKYIARMTLM